MKKLIISILALLIILGLGWGIATSMLSNSTEEKLTERIAWFNTYFNKALRNNLPEEANFGFDDEVKISLKDYKKGFLGSEGVINIQPVIATAEEAPQTIELKLAITHGPLLWRPGNDSPSAFGVSAAKLELLTDNLPSEVQAQLRAWFADKPPFTVDILQGFGRKTAFDFNSNALNYQDDESNFSLAPLGIKGSVQVQGNGADAIYEVPSTLEMGKTTLSFDNQADSFSLENVKGKNNMRINQSGHIIYNESDISIPGISIGSDELPVPISFNLTLQSKDERNAEDIGQGNLQINITELLTPFLPSSDVIMTLNYAGLNITALEELEEKLQTNDENEFEDEALLNETIATVFKEVLRAGESKLDTSLKLQNKLGQSSLAIGVNYKGEPTGKTLDSVAALEELLPQDWANMLHGEIDFSFDRDLFPMAALFLQGQPFIIPEGEMKYVMNLKMNGNTYELNGKQMDFAEFSTLIGTTLSDVMPLIEDDSEEYMEEDMEDEDMDENTMESLTEEEVAELMQLQKELEAMEIGDISIDATETSIDADAELADEPAAVITDTDNASEGETQPQTETETE